MRRLNAHGRRSLLFRASDPKYSVDLGLDIGLLYDDYTANKDLYKQLDRNLLN